jgi:hypothetical protein
LASWISGQEAKSKIKMAKIKEPRSEYEKLQYMLDVYEKILHPDFFSKFKTQLHKCYEENKREAYAEAKISDQALVLEKKLKDLRVSIGVMRDHPTVVSFYKKTFYKDLLKMLGQEDE